jgi:hypothetical protein
MWWVAVLVPVVVLAIVIAVAPVAIGSVRFHRWHTRRLPRRPADVGRRRVRCQLCLEATGLDDDHASSASVSTGIGQGPAHSG